MPAGYTYDAAGNVLNDGVNQYLYDNEERICAVYDPTTGAMTGYVYDANGDRVAKGALTSFSCNMASNGFSLITSYVLDKDGHEVSVFNGSTWQYSNIYAAGKLLATYTNSPSEVDVPLTDWLGTKRVTLHPKDVNLSHTFLLGHHANEPEKLRAGLSSFDVLNHPVCRHYHLSIFRPDSVP